MPLDRAVRGSYPKEFWWKQNGPGHRKGGRPAPGARRPAVDGHPDMAAIGVTTPQTVRPRTIHTGIEAFVAVPVGSETCSGTRIPASIVVAIPALGTAARPGAAPTATAATARVRPSVGSATEPLP